MCAMRATATTVVPVPIETAWEVLADHEGMSGWGPGLIVELTRQGAPERNGLGARRRIATRLPAPAIVEEIVGYEPGRRLSYRAVSGVPLRNYVGDVVLTPEGSGTKIDYSVSVDPRIPLVDRAAANLIARGLLVAYARAARNAVR